MNDYDPDPRRWIHYDMLPKEIREFLITCPIDIEVGLDFVMIANLSPEIALYDLKDYVKGYMDHINYTGVSVMWTRPK